MSNQRRSTIRLLAQGLAAGLAMGLLAAPPAHADYADVDLRTEVDIRIKGTLDGYNPDGTLKKTGEWLEWNVDGQVIRRESYP